MLKQELLDILACPKCKSEEKQDDGSMVTKDLVYDKDANTLSCEICKLRYRIEDDIPVMLLEEAESY